MASRQNGRVSSYSPFDEQFGARVSTLTTHNRESKYGTPIWERCSRYFELLPNEKRSMKKNWRATAWYYSDHERSKKGKCIWQDARAPSLDSPRCSKRWDEIIWEDMQWVDMRWDEMGWNEIIYEMIYNGLTWEMRWDGMGWDEKRSEAIRWDHLR